MKGGGPILIVGAGIGEGQMGNVDQDKFTGAKN